MRSFCIDWAQFGKKSLSVIRNSRVVAVQLFFFYCGNGDAIGTSVSVRYIVDVRSSGVVVRRSSTVFQAIFSNVLGTRLVAKVLTYILHTVRMHMYTMYYVHVYIYRQKTM